MTGRTAGCRWRPRAAIVGEDGAMQLSMLRTCGATAILTLAVACGGDSAGPEPLDPATRDDLCQADCARLIGCENPPTQTPAECVAGCQNDLGAWVRTDVAVDVFDCRSHLACGANDDACVTCSPTDAHRRFETACRANLATCDVDLDSMCLVTINPAVSGDAGLVCILTPTIVDELTACIPTGVDCTTGLTCIDTVFANHGVNF